MRLSEVKFEKFTEPGEYHIRRPGEPMQPTLCGQIHSREGEVREGTHYVFNRACATCLSRLEVDDGYGR